MELLKIVGLEDQAYKLPTAVSSGQQQSAAIARALATDPSIILADEPTGNLDSRSADNVLNLFESLARQGKTVLIVTHDPSITKRTDQTIILSGIKAAKDYPVPLRRVKFYDAEHDKLLVFLTNNFDLPALTIAQLYRCRWQVELFFKWIKQHLRIKAFFGPSENAVKTQVWIALSTYILVAIVKKRLHAKASLYTILQVLSLTLFEKTSLLQSLGEPDNMILSMTNDKKLNLFD